MNHRSHAAHHVQDITARIMLASMGYPVEVPSSPVPRVEKPRWPLTADEKAALAATHGRAKKKLVRRLRAKYGGTQ